MSGKRPAMQEHKDSPPRKKVKPTPTPSIQDSRISSSVSSGASTSVSRERHSKSKKTALEKLSARTSKAPVAPRSERDRQEDTYITFLEKKLGWRKGSEKTKNYGTGLDDDGLGGTSHAFGLCKHT
jgi:nucleolar MIF4G domain-containing protein 1